MSERYAPASGRAEPVWPEDQRAGELPVEPRTWLELKRLFARTFSSSLHFAVASVGADGEPCLTPVGAVFLGEPGHAFYLELYATGLGRRLALDPRVAILAVDSGRLLWFRSLLSGRFARVPAVRLRGLAAREPRAPTSAELARIARRLGAARFLPGGRVLWPNLDAAARLRVRDLEIHRIEPVHLGRMPVPRWR
ncbi:MAG: pyridoxamine 5'-phosphate oxidase family protein [Polyangiaceae bacterium]